MNIDYYKNHEPFFGSWYIKKQIGEGSFGKVFEAEREDFGRVYKSAIKIITIPQNESEIKSAMSEGMDEQSTRSYFREIVSELISEFDIMSKLKGNTNIVSYEDHAVFEHEEGIGWDIVIRMELLTPLLDYVQYNPLKAKDAVKLGIDMCSALEVCRRHNIIHRDIKPQNIFVSSDGNFKLGDFGIARTVEKTTSGLSKKGTYTYMAPEVYKGQPYNLNVDIYSLGIVLYQFLNQNRTPFLPEYPAPITYTAKEQALEKRIKGEQIPPLKSVSRELSDVVLKACAYNPRDRYSDATEFKNALMNVSSSGEDSIKDRADEFGDEGTVGIFSNDPVAQNAIPHGASDIPMGQPAIDDLPFGRNYDYNAEPDEEKTTSLFTKTESGTVGMFGETNNAPSDRTEAFGDGGFDTLTKKEHTPVVKEKKATLRNYIIWISSVVIPAALIVAQIIGLFDFRDMEDGLFFSALITFGGVLGTGMLVTKHLFRKRNALSVICVLLVAAVLSIVSYMLYKMLGLVCCLFITFGGGYGGVLSMIIYIGRKRDINRWLVYVATFVISVVGAISACSLSSAGADFVAVMIFVISLFILVAMMLVLNKIKNDGFISSISVGIVVGNIVAWIILIAAIWISKAIGY